MTVYTSRVLIKDFLDELIADMGLYQQRDRAFYRERMNEALSFLYKAVIRWREEGEGVPQSGRLSCAAITSSVGTAMQGPDVLAVFRGSRQLRYLPPADLPAAAGMEGFYTVTNDMILLSDGKNDRLRVIYLVRPLRYHEESESTVIPLPDEFIPMLAARVRGEAYRLAGEDELAAKWLAVYNAGLADFYDYLAVRQKGR